MAWLKTLAETYDVYSDLAGVDRNGQAVLLPVSHSTFNAQIEVTIDKEGNFQGAKKLEKGRDVVTIIPVTEDSAARGNGNFPHSLCDKLCYIAGDYTLYTGDDMEEYYEAYMAQLRDWVKSDYTHPMVQAVYTYLEKKLLIHDLVTSKTLELDDNGKLTDQTKIHGSGQTGANIRFIVRGSSMPQEVWKNQELYKKYSEYYQQKSSNKKLCYASGEIKLCSDKHPSKIRNSADKAKLISGNDESGFTYRGRFTSKEQAASVGYDTSQKAHNALRWLIQKQGYTCDESAIVCWMVNRDVQLPDMMKDSINACNDIENFDFDFNMIGSDETLKMNKHDTGKYFAEKFNNAVKGYIGNFTIDDKVAIIALDGADTTKGRISVAFYDEMGGKQYADAI
ncbi:MAG: type I-C CRISPR-associated protein Cas8c/Csd1, partial [Lachnospiraceae bacterium]|nr:type I-C CRISPR-associated protein Cas8c/Csd1 [Lachnospiraceae bacterium]